MASINEAKTKEYNILEVLSNTEQPTPLDMFVSKIGEEYHVLGLRPQKDTMHFFKKECSSLDLGIVELPKDRPSLKDLVIGDTINIREYTSPDKFISFTYQGMSE